MYNELIPRDITYIVERDDIEIPCIIRTALYIEGDILFNLDDINAVSYNTLEPYVIPDYVYGIFNNQFIINPNRKNMEGFYITYEGLIVALNNYSLDNNEGLYDVENWLRDKAIPMILKGFIAPIIEAIKGEPNVNVIKPKKEEKEEVPLPFTFRP